jgi:hypothetical protein
MRFVCGFAGFAFVAYGKCREAWLQKRQLVPMVAVISIWREVATRAEDTLLDDAGGARASRAS